MIHIDKSKCAACGACVRDCVVHVLTKGEDGFPVFRNAPCMVVASTPKNAPCREADPWIALSYFDLLAQANGFGTCWSGFAVRAFKWMRRIRHALRLPRGHAVGAVLLFGMPDVAYARVPHPRPMSVVVQ